MKGRGTESELEAMLDTHYIGLFAAYGTLVAGTFFLRWLGGRSEAAEPVWPACERVELKRPWLDVGLFFVGVACVIGVGQLYMADMLIPAKGTLWAFADAVNQFLIFSPILLLLVVRRQGLRTAYLPGDRIARRLAAGVGLALAAGVAYSIATRDFTSIANSVAGEASSGWLPAHVVQVFMEDLLIAALLVRLAAGLRSELGAGLLVAVLFAASHLPAMFAGEDPVGTREIVRLGMDAAIGVIVMVGLVRTRDVLWLYPTHLLMDIAQF